AARRRPAPGIVHSRTRFLSPSISIASRWCLDPDRLSTQSSWPGLARGPSAHGLDPWASASCCTRLAGFRGCPARGRARRLGEGMTSWDPPPREAPNAGYDPRSLHPQEHYLCAFVSWGLLYQQPAGRRGSVILADIRDRGSL